MPPASKMPTAPLPPVRDTALKSYVPWLMGLIYFVVHIPLAYRYDLWYGTHVAVNYLQSKRILAGEIPFYFWGNQHAGTLPHFLVALAIYVFGPSIVLANLINIGLWAIGLVLAVDFVERTFGRRAAILGGTALVVGVPWFGLYEASFFGSQYNLMLLIIFGFFWLTLDLLAGATLWKMFRYGLIFGLCFYLNKQMSVPIITLAVVVFLLSENRIAIGRILKARLIAVLLLGLLIGYLPELVFKLRGGQPRPDDPVEAYSPKSDGMKFFDINPPAIMVRNVYWLARVIPAYFDADPLYRGPMGIHYLNHLEDEESFPRSAGDIVGVVAGIFTIGFAWRHIKRGYLLRNNRVLCMALLPFINAAMMLVGGFSEGNYFMSIRYIFPAGLMMLLWMGVLVDHAWRRRKWAVVGLLGFCVLQSLVHRYEMLRLPDELHDFRQVVSELESNQVQYGATIFSYSHVLTALSQENVIFAAIDREAYATYLHAVKAQPEIALVYPTYQATLPEHLQRLLFGNRRQAPQKLPDPGPTIRLWNIVYSAAGEAHTCGEVSWRLFRKGTTAPEGKP